MRSPRLSDVEEPTGIDHKGENVVLVAWFFTHVICQERDGDGLNDEIRAAHKKQQANACCNDNVRLPLILGSH